MTTPEQATGGDRLAASERTTVHRYGEMQSWRRDDLYSVLDEGLVAHVGFTAKHGPVVIPMAYAHDREHLYMHGSTGSGLGLAGGAGADLAVTVSIVDGFVYASSLFDSTFNYRCAMVFGTAVPVSEQERYEAARLPIVTRVLAPVPQPGVDAPVPPSVTSATASLGGPVAATAEAGPKGQ